MDDRLLEFLVGRGVPTFSMSSGLSLDDFGWGTPTFHKMGREKINLIYTFTKLGFDVLLSDVDTVWLRNPVPYMQQARRRVFWRPVPAGLSLLTCCVRCPPRRPCPTPLVTRHLQYPEADILTSSDHLINTVTDEGLERWPDAASAANIGIMLFRPKAHELAAVSLAGRRQRCWADVLGSILAGQ